MRVRPRVRRSDDALRLPGFLHDANLHVYDDHDWLVAFAYRCHGETKSTLRDTERGAVLAVGILQRILPSRKVNRSHPWTSTRLPSARVPVNVHSDTPLFPSTKWRALPQWASGKVTQTSEAGPHCLPARVPGAAAVRACRGLEDAVIAHERHESIDIVAIPGIGESLQDLGGDRSDDVRHDFTSFDFAHVAFDATEPVQPVLDIDLAAMRSGRTRAIKSVSQYSSYRAILPSRKWITKT